MNTLPQIVNSNCPNQQVTIQANVQGGVAPLVYSWTGNTSTTNQITVTPVANSTFNYTVSDACGQSRNGNIQVQIAPYTPLDITGNTPPIILCKGDSVSLIPIVTGGGGDYEFLWSFGSTDSVVKYPVTKTETVFVTVTDKCNFTINRNFSLNLNYPTFSVDGGLNQSVCVGDQVTLDANASGGRKGNGDYKYFWNGVQGKSRNFTVNQNTSFIVEAFDSCGIISALHEQSSDINQGVDRKNPEEQGAGDQGMMFGYATNETENYMPLALDLSHMILKELAALRRENKEITYLRPDSKSQVTIEYSDDNVPQRIDAIVVSTQHDDFDEEEAMLAKIKSEVNAWMVQFPLY